MAFGLDLNGAGPIIPIIKYDSRAGRMQRVDRADGINVPVDITNDFKAVFDLENVEKGWIDFSPGRAPSFKLVRIEDKMPPQPTPDHRQGVRIMLKLANDGGVRELATAAKAALGGLNELHDAYQTSKDAHPGQLPVVVLKSTVPITTGSGPMKSTNYRPVFEIVGWAPRPADLVWEPKNKPDAMPGIQQAQPPATGSTIVGAPLAGASLGDFGNLGDFG
jgi:hypothetical protein